jgi:serine/threonine protein kinase
MSYRCAPNDVWSLGVVLVNLACGRNPWKQASVEDSTYRAFTRNRNFLKTILPLSDELNNILGMIFERNPEERITVSELKYQILNCSTFSATSQAQAEAAAAAALVTPPQSPTTCPESAMEEDNGYGSDHGSMSSEGSLTGSCSTVSDTDSDSGSLSDSDFGSAEGHLDQETELFENVIPEAKPQVQRPAAPVFAPQPTYVLPSQDPPFHGNSNPWNIPVKPNHPFQNWGQYEHQYEQFPATSRVHQAVYSHPYPAHYSPQYHYTQNVWLV